VNSSRFYSTTLLAVLEGKILVVLLMVWRSLSFFKEKPRSRCLILLLSFTLTSTVHYLQDLPNPLSVMHLSHHLSLPLKISMCILLYLLGQQILSPIGSSIAVRPTIDIEEGKHPCRKVPIVPKARRNARPHLLIRWTSSTDVNKMLAQKIEDSAIYHHSLSCRCSGSTQMTCHLMHSLILPAKWTPAFHAVLRVSLQYENAETLSFESS